MHKIAMEMGKWAMEQAKAHGFDNITSQEWDDLKDCMEIVKCAVCADKDYRIVEAMDEAEEEEKYMGRMGYRGRDARTGRFVHRSGRGRSAGYMPYLHMMDGMEDYEDMYDYLPEMMTGYRMGYTDGNGGRGGNMGNSGRSSSGGSYSGNYGGNSGSGSNGGRYGYEGMKRPSRYGDAYDRYDEQRRHYTESRNPEDKKAVKQSINEIFSDVDSMIENIMEYADAADKPEIKQKVMAMAQKVQGMK